MIVEDYKTEITVTSFTQKFKHYFQLLKFRLSSTVAFSAVMGYMLGTKGNIELYKIFVLIISGIMITGASNIINQILEKDIDLKMSRTKKRPLPANNLTIYEAKIFASILAIVGFTTMTYFFNWNTSLLSLASLLLYGFAYTPMKTKNSIAVFIGAFPGAFPPMIGWLAATNHYGWEPGILFAIQFVWQFPHFWAIAWVLDDDYKKAGIKLLPADGGKDIKTAFRIMIYALMLIPLGFVPYFLGMTGINSAFIALICGVLFLSQTFYLMKECTTTAAKYIMFGSFLYLPIVQIAYVWDKL